MVKKLKKVTYKHIQGNTENWKNQYVTQAMDSEILLSSEKIEIIFHNIFSILCTVLKSWSKIEQIYEWFLFCFEKVIDWFSHFHFLIASKSESSFTGCLKIKWYYGSLCPQMQQNLLKISSICQFVQAWNFNFHTWKGINVPYH